MDSKKWILKQTAVIAASLAGCTGAMFGVYALIGKFSANVLIGGIVGWAISVGYFFFMSIGNARVADAVTGQDAVRGKAMAQGGALLRYVIIFAVLVVGAKTGLCDPFAMVIPLGLMRPVLMICEFIRK